MNTSEKIYMVASADLTPRGDGSYILKPHKPEQWLWTRDAAKMCNVSTDTIVRWWKRGLIRGRKAGPARVQIDSESLIAYLKNGETAHPPLGIG